MTLRRFKTAKRTYLCTRCHRHQLRRRRRVISLGMQNAHRWLLFY